MTVWLTKRGAADYAAISPDAIAAAVNRGDLPAFAIGKSGREYRLRAEDIDAWMMSRAWEPAR